ncbi:MAG: TetR/AcrR family transcriptional regulator [Nannocystaceae bacterium]|nr:TetR/AcrR family transcriptional regulator [bacterium]
MPRRPRTPRQPKQERSRFLADAVVEAAARVVREVGWSRAKVGRIAKVAGVSVGSLYRYFPGRDVLLGAVIDRALARDSEAFEAALQRLDGGTIEESLRSFIDALVGDDRLTDPRLLRHLVDVLDAAGRLETVRTLFDGMVRRFAERLVETHPELGPIAVVERRSHIAFWGLRSAFVARVRVEDPFDLPAFREDAEVTLHALLRTPATR